MIKLIEVEPNKWRVDRPRPQKARSDLPLPNVISDIMPETEQVDGKFYTSKSQFRKVGRSLGLIEIGTEKLKPRIRNANVRADKDRRIAAVKTAIEKYQAGHRR
jgi:hypothetical protein